MLCRVAVVRIGELGTTLAQQRSVLRSLVTANGGPSLPIHIALMMEAIRSSETSALTRATLLNIQEEGILLSHRRENLKSYKS
jgi:hypothetical protein